jgi:hypothetical protein
MSLHSVRDASPGRKYATTHLCIPLRGCIPDGMHDNYTRVATERYNPDGLPDVHVFQLCLRPSALKLTTLGSSPMSST